MGGMDEPDPDRPTALLPLGQLVRLSVYWLGLVAIVQGIGIILQERITVLVPDTSIQYTTLGALQVAGIVLAVVVQPTVGTLSDYTVSRLAGASRTSPSAPSSTSCSWSASRRRTRCSPSPRS